MTKTVHRESAAEPFMIKGGATDLEKKLIDAVVAVLGDEMAFALDNGHVISGSEPVAEIQSTVDIEGIPRRVKLTFAMANVKS